MTISAIHDHQRGDLLCQIYEFVVGVRSQLQTMNSVRGSLGILQVDSSLGPGLKMLKYLRADQTVYDCAGLE
jgi:hypothetical protein